MWFCVSVPSRMYSESYDDYSANFYLLSVHKVRKSAVSNFSVTPSSRPTLSKFSKSYIPLVLESTCQRRPSGYIPPLSNILACPSAP